MLDEEWGKLVLGKEEWICVGKAWEVLLAVLHTLLFTLRETRCHDMA